MKEVIGHEKYVKKLHINVLNMYTEILEVIEVRTIVLQSSFNEFLTIIKSENGQNKRLC